MKRLFKIAAVMSVATFTGMAVGVLRAKVTAVMLGPAGVGIFSQAVTFFQTVETICGLGIVLGVTKYVSEMWRNKNFNSIRHIIYSSFFMQGLSFCLLFIFVSIFANNISQFIFSSTKYSLFLIFIPCAALFSVFITVLESTLIGIGKPNVFSKSRVLYFIVGLVLLVLFVGWLRLKGGFIYICVNAVISFFLVLMFLKSSFKEHNEKVFLPWQEVRKISFLPYFKKLSSYGSVALVGLTVTWLTVLYVRSTLIREEGALANGLYQVIFAMVSYYTPFFTNAFWGYLFPKLSALKSMARFNVELNKTIRFVLLFLTPVLSLLFLLKRVFIIVVFSEAFLPSLALFPLYLFGSFFFMLVYVFGTALLARKRLKAYLCVNISQNIGYALLFTVLLGVFGLRAIAISYLVTNVLAGFVMLVYMFNRMGLKVKTKNMQIFVMSVIFNIFIFFTPSATVLSYVYKTLLIGIWFLFVIGKKEKALLFSFIGK